MVSGEFPAGTILVDAQAMPGPRGATDAIGLGPTVPRILMGKVAVATLPLGPNGARPLPIDQPDVAGACDRL
jgi:hypothetical protein